MMTLSSAIIDRLRDEILKGAIVPGTKLRADDLKSKFEVSTTPVREALVRLASEGLVIAEDQRGFRVAPISRENLKEVNALRIKLECMALRQAIANADLEWEAAIVATLHRLSVHNSRRVGSPVEINDEWEHCHRAFHMALISACGMPLLLGFCKALHDMSDRYRRVFLKATTPVDRQKEHERIANAACKRDANLAVQLLTQHIAATEALVLEAYDRQS